jgi:DNA-binding NarL/FixJ family response regulator
MDNLKVLLVEDNSSFREVIKEILQVSFPAVEIDESVDGDHALREVDAFSPDLILMDIHLPGENGLQLTRKIKATHPDVNVVVLTACDAPEYRAAAFRNGADDYLDKNSTNQAKLREVVKSYYEKRHALRS